MGLANYIWEIEISAHTFLIFIYVRISQGCKNFPVIINTNESLIRGSIRILVYLYVTYPDSVLLFGLGAGHSWC
jgi:hypothetical protein